EPDGGADRRGHRRPALRDPLPVHDAPPLPEASGSLKARSDSGGALPKSHDIAGRGVADAPSREVCSPRTANSTCVQADLGGRTRPSNKGGAMQQGDPQLVAAPVFVIGSISLAF